MRHPTALGAGVAALLAVAACRGPAPEEKEEADRAVREAAFLRGGTVAAQADAAWAAGDREGAAAGYEEAIADRPSVSRDAYRRIAEVREAEGRLDAACDWLERGLDRFPRDPALLRPLGLLYERQGRIAPALACYEAILTRQPDDPGASGAAGRLRKTLPSAPTGGRPIPPKRDEPAKP